MRVVRLTRLERRVLLALLDGPQRGYGIVCAVAKGSCGALLGPGRLYRIIDRLVDAGLVVECQPDPDGARRYGIARTADAAVCETAAAGGFSPASPRAATLARLGLVVRAAAARVITRVRRLSWPSYSR
jgi:hypothetical protein